MVFFLSSIEYPDIEKTLYKDCTWHTVSFTFINITETASNCFPSIKYITCLGAQWGLLRDERQCSQEIEAEARSVRRRQSVRRSWTAHASIKIHYYYTRSIKSKWPGNYETRDNARRRSKPRRNQSCEHCRKSRNFPNFPSTLILSVLCSINGL